MRHVLPSRPNVYAGGTLDRAGHLRSDAAWVEAARLDAASRFVLFRHGKALISTAGGTRAVLADRPEGDVTWVFLGLQDGVPIFAADLPAAHEPGPAEAALDPLLEPAFMEMYGVSGALPADDAAILATARGMLHWRAHNRFCAFCGGANTPQRGGHVLQCAACGREHFPRSDPAVIMLVTRHDKLLLGQSHRFPADRNWYSTLAGFVEPGESLEDAVRREVLEEVGVRVGEVAYHSSQPWPFPASLMLGYYAEGLSDEIVLEAAEMRDARWFTRDEIANREALGFDLPGPESIARRLIDDWLAD